MKQMLTIPSGLGTLPLTTRVQRVEVVKHADPRVRQLRICLAGKETPVILNMDRVAATALARAINEAGWTPF